jgi:hypothetical protein
MKIRTKRISRGLTAGLTTLALAAAPVFAQNPYRIATVAGAIYDRSGNNGPATQASITGLGAAFRGGYLYLTDSFRIWRIDPSGKITTVVGVLTPNPPLLRSPAMRVTAGRPSAQGCVAHPPLNSTPAETCIYPTAAMIASVK